MDIKLWFSHIIIVFDLVNKECAYVIYYIPGWSMNFLLEFYWILNKTLDRRQKIIQSPNMCTKCTWFVFRLLAQWDRKRLIYQQLRDQQQLRPHKVSFNIYLKNLEFSQMTETGLKQNSDQLDFWQFSKLSAISLHHKVTLHYCGCTYTCI